MPLSEIQIVLQWWLVIFGLGFLFSFLSRIIFPSFVDKGYVFAKTLGIIITSYLALISGIFHFSQFNRNNLLFLAALPFLCYLFWLFIIKKQNFNIFSRKKKGTKKLLGIILIEEILFLAGLFYLSYIRAFAPDIHGLEKYMDFGFINSIARGDFFPARDMWLTPFSINYYYFGHLATAVLTKISGLPTSLTYNLMLATVLALCFTSCFSIGINLFSPLLNKPTWFSKKTLIAGLLCASIVTFAGNIHTIYAFFVPYENEKPVPFWTLKFASNNFPNGYWYPNATRFIHNTIHEFPMYSWTVSDLHGHVLDIPFVLLTIAVLLSFFQQNKTDKKKSLFSLRKDAVYMLAIGFLLAVMYMTNAWDGIIYFLLTGAILLYLQSSRTHDDIKNKTSNNPFLQLQSISDRQKLKLKTFFIKHRFFDFFSGLSLYLILLGFFAFIFAQPFTYFFKPFVSGIGILCAPSFLTKIEHFGPILFEAAHCQKSPIWQLFILHGFFYFFAISFFIFLFKQKKHNKSDIFVLILIGLSTLLIILPEFIYAKDIYPAHYRANTMFKLVFQSFMMLGIASGYIIVRIISSFQLQATRVNFFRKLPSFLFIIITTCLLILVFVYPYLATKGYYGELKAYHSIDGTKYLSALYPDDFKAITWINDNIKGQPVILEAQGDSYTDFARVSANTGLPTVLGWTVHEWLWRGSYDIPSPRITEITTLYETKDMETAKSLLKKYNITFVFLGALEKQKYPKLDEEKYTKLGKIIYQSGTTKIYKLSL